MDLTLSPDYKHAASARHNLAQRLGKPLATQCWAVPSQDAQEQAQREHLPRQWGDMRRGRRAFLVTLILMLMVGFSLF
uniref:Uncharacterized protein n=1 Tax=Magnetococcus massalia (strain MO-1) TaxID=451514 RepID=A0A1S7LD09_MAGMO|nr:Protein of unknown function [Candidatus Magnetococcus massalia]